MVRSMTGFGKAYIKSKFGIIQVEIRSFNHKFFEISERLPVNLLDLEERIKEYIQARIKRGRFNLVLSHINSTDKAFSYNLKEIIINKKLASQYHRILTNLKTYLRLKEEPSISHIISLPNVLIFRENYSDTRRLWPVMKSVIDKALEGLISMREKEGRFLYKDLVQHITSIERSIQKIERFQPEVVRRFRNNLTKRLKEFTGGDSINREKLEDEVVIFTRNSDISEELIRLKSHIINLKRILNEEDEVGRKLDFIAQELQREINTIGSKSESFKISKEVIEIKSCIDKIKEQAQNIE